MKSCIALLVIASSVLVAQAAPLENPLGSSIAEVTVYADRAQVVRQSAVSLPAGISRHTLTNLPGWLDEGSVRVRLANPGAGRILDVQIERTFLAKPSSEEFLSAEASLQDVTDQLSALDDEKAVLDAQGKHLEAMRVFSLEKLPKDSAVREVKTSEFVDTLKFLSTTLRETSQARRDLEKKKREIQPELDVRRKKLAELKSRAQLEQHNIIVTTESTAAAKTDLLLTYMLPGATWNPVHELRTSADGRSITLASYAVVMQTSGEDWTDVKLSLSTQNSSETMKIPELEALLVGSGRTVAKVQTISSFGLANTKYLQQNAAWNMINNPDEMQQEFRGNQALVLDNGAMIGQVFATLQERGTTAHFHAQGNQTVRTDGRKVRVPLTTRTLSAAQRVLAAPEVSLNAALTVDLTNVGEQSILPGKVSLFQAGAFLGLTETEFVAPGETFSLYLGVDENIKLTRVLDKKRSELKRGSRKNKMEVSFLVTVENLSDEPRQVQLTDRVPVSQEASSRVYGVKVEPSIKPDSDGLVTWEVALAAKETRQFRIEYDLEYPAGLESQQTDGQADPSTIKFQREIMKLEKHF